MTVQGSAPTLATPTPPQNQGFSALDSTTANPSSDNIFCLIALILGNNDKLNRAAKPSDEKETIAYIEQALSQATNSADFASNMSFWASLKNSLPKDSSLLPYVTGQFNLFANNPGLKRLQDQYGTDFQKLQDALGKLKGCKDAEGAVEGKIDEVKKEIRDLLNDWGNDPWYKQVFVDPFTDGAKLAGLTCELGGLYIALGAVKGTLAGLSWIESPDGAQSTVDADLTSIEQEKTLTNAKSKNFNLQSGDEASSVLNAVKQANNTTLTGLTQEAGIAKLLNAVSVSKA